MSLCPVCSREMVEGHTCEAVGAGSCAPGKVERVSGPVTRLLSEWGGGDADAPRRLWPLVYDELRRLAQGYMRAERPSHTLQATALVHEAFVRLVGSGAPPRSRAHFMGVAASAMRHILVDHARAGRSEKRGGHRVQVTLGEAAGAPSRSLEGLIALDEALGRLETIDARKGRLVERLYFGGMTQEEIAEAEGLSIRTVQRELRQARAWLYRELA